MSNPMGAGARQGIVSLVVKDKPTLYRAYMPYLRNGGIFVPTTRRYFIGDEVFLLLTLPESSERLPVAGKVVWVTPTGAQGNRTTDQSRRNHERGRTTMLSVCFPGPARGEHLRGHCVAFQPVAPGPVGQ